MRLWLLSALLSGCGWSPEGQDLRTPDTGLPCSPEAWDPAAAALEAEMLAAVNEARAQGARCGDQDLPATEALSMAPELRCAARRHSLDMVERGFFDHVNPDGDDVSVRVEDEGYGWVVVGENILQGDNLFGDVDSALAAWLQSPGHCSNIHEGLFTELGVGVWVEGARTTWTQVFADR